MRYLLMTLTLVVGCSGCENGFAIASLVVAVISIAVAIWAAWYAKHESDDAKVRAENADLRAEEALTVAKGAHALFEAHGLREQRRDEDRAAEKKAPEVFAGWLAGARNQRAHHASLPGRQHESPRAYVVKLNNDVDVAAARLAIDRATNGTDPDLVNTDGQVEIGGTFCLFLRSLTRR